MDDFDEFKMDEFESDEFEIVNTNSSKKRDILLKICLFKSSLKAKSNRSITLMMEAKQETGLWVSMSNSDGFGNMDFEFPDPIQEVDNILGDCLYSFAFCLSGDHSNDRHKLIELDIYDTMVDITGNLDETECTTYLIARNLKSPKEENKYFIREKLAGLPKSDAMELYFKFKPDPNRPNSNLIRKKVLDGISVVWHDTTQTEKLKHNVTSRTIEFDEVMAAVLLKPNIVQLYPMSNNMWAVSKRREHDWLSAFVHLPSPEVFAELGDEFFIGCRTEGTLKIFMRITRTREGFEIEPLPKLSGELQFFQMIESPEGNLVEKSIFPVQEMTNTKLKFQGSKSHCLVKALVRPKSVTDYPYASITKQNSVKWTKFHENAASNLNRQLV